MITVNCDREMKGKGLPGKLFLMFAALFAIGQIGFSQTFTGDSIVSLPGRPGIYRLVGHVKIEHNGNRIHCDFSDYNQKTGSCLSYGNLRIRTATNVQITGEALDYNGTTGVYVVDRNVVMKDGEMTMETPSLVYDGRQDKAHYKNGGRMLSGETELVSRRGYHDGRSETFHCFDSVVIVHPDYTIHTDTLQHAKSGLTKFKGKTDIVTTEYTMYGRRGWFNQNEDKVSLQKDACVKTTSSQILFGDSIYYDLGNKKGKVFNNVYLKDTVRNCYLKGDYAENDEKAGYAMMAKQPRGVTVENNDSLFLAGDTMIMTYDTARHVKQLFVYHNVRFFKEDIQGRCDSLVYTHADSLLQLFHKPMLWVEGYQIDGDSVKVWFSNSKPHKLLIRENAFITTPASEKQRYYNQVKGRRIWGYFDDSSQFRLAHVVGLAQSIYYVLGENPGELLGVNKTESESLKMYFENNEVKGVTVVKPSKSAIYPVHELSERERTLRGFHWKPELWPRSKTDIHPLW